jgi:hypothetical protein
MWCFVHFDFDMCFALQQRAIFDFSSPQYGSAPAALLSLLFAPPAPQNIGKNPSVVDFSTFSCTLIFFLLTLSLLTSSLLCLFPPLLLQSASSIHIVGSLTSKLNVWSFWTKLSNVSILQRALSYPNRIGKFANIYAIILISYLGPWGVFLQNLQRCKSYHIPGPQCAVCFRFTAHISDFIQGNMCRKTVSVPSSVIKRGWEIPVNWKFEWRNQSNSGWSIFQHV